ncbi:MAG: DMT family transporter [Bacteroidia bacterium]
MSKLFLGYLSAFITVISWTIGSIWFTRASRLINPSSVNRVRLLYAFLLLGVLVCVIMQLTPLQLFTSVTQNQYFWFSLSGLVGLSIGDYYTFNAFKILGPRRTTLFNCFAPGAALLAGYIIVNENIGFVALLGMLISISGILLITLSRTEKNQVLQEGYGSYANGVFAGVMSALCQGVGLVLAKKGFSVEPNSQISAIHATWIRMFSAVIFSYGIGFFKTNLFEEFKMITFNKKFIKPVIIGTTFGPVIGVSLSLVAARNIPVSIAQTILSMVPVSVTITGILFYKEKISTAGFLALLLSIIGVLLLTLF